MSRYVPKFRLGPLAKGQPEPSEDNDSNGEEEDDHEQDNFGGFGDDTSDVFENGKYMLVH